MAAAAEYAWLTTGTYRGQPPAYWRLHTQEGLLLWLVNGPFTTSPSHGPFRDVCWTGDEGVFLNALTAYINGVADQSLKPTLVKDGRTLIDAAMTFFVANDVMHESPRNPDWSNDLATGKGVFMRLVTRFVLQHGFFGDAAFETQFKAFVSATAEAAWCTRLIPKVGDKTKWVIAPSWTPDSPPQEKSQDTTDDLWPQVLQTNGLDALNAAVLIG
jgi:hypothetical protein